MIDAATDAARGEAIAVGELSIWADLQGPADGTPVVLMAGADSPGFRWSPALVRRLLESGRRVLRYDHRDCGRSTRFGAETAYLLDDLADDVVGLLDHFSLDRADLVGFSMGGMVAQVLALDHPDRVRSLTIFGSSPAPGDETLGGPTPDFVEVMTERLFAGPPRDTGQQVEWLVQLAELLHGPRYPFDTDRQRTLARLEIATGWAAETGHGVAVHASPSRRPRLGEIGVPSLVVHGSADPVFGPAHGQALATGIDDAVLVEVDGLGHEVPDPLIEDLWPVLSRFLTEKPS